MKNMIRKLTPVGLALLVASVTLAVFIPAIRNDFINWDDNYYIVEVMEQYRIHGMNVELIKWALTNTTFNYWHPATLLSHAVDYGLWGMNPVGHHLTSIVLHAVNTFLVVFLVTRLLGAWRRTLDPAMTSARPAAVAFRLQDGHAILIAAGTTGLLFGIHPLRVESVVWISQRKDLLCTLFVLLSIVSYSAFAEIARSASEKGKPFYFKRHYIMSLIFFILALASKPMAVSLPFVLLLLDWHPFGRISSRQQAFARAAEKIPFIIPIILVSAITISAQTRIGAMISLSDSPLLSRLLLAAAIPFLYLLKMVLPVHLSPIYPAPLNISFLSFSYSLPAVLVVMVTILCLFMARKHRTVPAVWGYYLVSLLPVAGIIRVGYTPVADRFTYLPSIGPFLLAGIAVAWCWSKADSIKTKTFILKSALSFVVLLIVISMTYLTMQQAGIWKNSLVFWNYILEKEPRMIPIAYANRGAVYADKGDFERAMEDFNRGIYLDPTEYVAYNNRGTLFKLEGQYEQARDDYTMAIELNPAFVNAYTNRGWVNRKLGQLDMAIEDYTKAIDLKPSYIAYTNRGIALYEQGQTDRALKDFDEALRLNPEYVDAYISRGLVLEETGKPEQAVDDYNRAIALNPENVDAFLNRGVGFERMGKLDRALEDYSKAIELNPSDYLAYGNRGVVFAKTGQSDRAIEDYTRALALNNDFVKAYLDRGDLYVKAGKMSLAVDDYRKACRLGSKAGCYAIDNLKKRQGS